MDEALGAAGHLQWIRSIQQYDDGTSWVIGNDCVLTVTVEAVVPNPPTPGAAPLKVNAGKLNCMPRI